MTGDFFLTRHSKKPKGEDIEDEKYKGISRKGVELARESSKNILKYLEKSPKDSVIFLGGVSDEVRTKSTAEVYGNELKNLLANRSNEYVVITKEDISSEARKKGYTGIARELKSIIDLNPNKRIIIDIPLFLKELSLRGRWGTKEGKMLPYTEKLLQKNNMDEYAALKDWIQNGGDIDGVKGPKPIDVAKSYERGLNRLEKFAKRYAGDRPYVTGLVGHSWDSDVFLTYLAGNGQINLSALEKISSGKGMIKETEMASVNIAPEITTLTYRGEEHQIKRNLESLTGVLSISSLVISLLSFSGITGNVIGIGKNNFFGLVSLGLAVIFGLVFFFLRKKRK